MDPVSQAAVGSAVSGLSLIRDKQTKRRVKTFSSCLLAGAFAGMAPDLDVLIRSNHDPLLALELHRHFSHSLLFIPFGALICAAAFYPLFLKRTGISFATAYLWCLLGYGSHGLLDGHTTYGTHLLWPLSDARVAWNNISVVDPLFTVPLVLSLIVAAVMRSRIILGLGLVWACLYLVLGYFQHERAERIGYEIADARGHNAIDLSAKPSFANLLVWKTVYEFDDRFYVDAVRVGFREVRIWEGESIAKLDVAKQFSWLDMGSQQARDIERFRRFSSGFIGVDPRDPDSIVDIRYSLLPQQIAPLWGIRLSPNAGPDDHVEYFGQRDEPANSLERLWRMITNK